MLKKLRKNKKGFTLAELLIVVAIIGVLVAISIPIFTSQLEKAREATDEANIRNAYAVVQSAALTEEKQDDLSKNDVDGLITYTVSGAAGTYKYTAKVTLKQQQNGWQSNGGTAPTIGGMTITDTPSAGGTATVEYDVSTGKTTLTFNAKSGS